MSKDREDPGPFRSKKYLSKLIEDDLTVPGVTDRKSMKVRVAAMWDSWEFCGNPELIRHMERLKLISPTKAKEEYQDARLRRRLHKAKERLKCKKRKT